MHIETTQKNGTEIAVIKSDTPLITDVQSALDLMMAVKYETGCTNIVISKEAITEDFFNLRTRLAGEILSMRATTEKIFISNLMLRLPLISFLVVRKKNRHQHNILSTEKNGIVTRDCAVFFNNLTKIF